MNDERGSYRYGDSKNSYGATRKPKFARDPNADPINPFQRISGLSAQLSEEDREYSFRWRKQMIEEGMLIPAEEVQ